MELRSIRISPKRKSFLCVRGSRILSSDLIEINAHFWGALLVEMATDLVDAELPKRCLVLRISVEAKNVQKRLFAWSLRLHRPFLKMDQPFEHWKVGVKRILISCESNNSLPVAWIVEYSRIMRAWIKSFNNQAFANQVEKEIISNWADICAPCCLHSFTRHSGHDCAIMACYQKRNCQLHKPACRTPVPLQLLPVKFARNSTHPWGLFEVLPHRLRTSKGLVHRDNWLHVFFFRSQVILRALGARIMKRSSNIDGRIILLEYSSNFDRFVSPLLKRPLPKRRDLSDSFKKPSLSD